MTTIFLLLEVYETGAGPTGKRVVAAYARRPRAIDELTARVERDINALDGDDYNELRAMYGQAVSWDSDAVARYQFRTPKYVVGYEVEPTELLDF